MKARVYFNLHKKLWSVQHYIPGKGWRVGDHVSSLILEDVVFKVSEAGRQRVIREGRKNVHAYAIGNIVPLGPHDHAQADKSISYNPYHGPSFMLNGEPVTHAERVLFSQRKKLFILQRYPNEV